MGTFNQLLRLAQENKEIALFTALAVLLLLLMVYLLIRSIFSPRRTASPPSVPPAYVPVAELAAKLRRAAEEIPPVLQQLQQTLEEKDRAVNEKRQYIEALDAQIKQLQEQIGAAGASPVLSKSEKELYERKITELQKAVRKKAAINWRQGFVWGAVLTLLAAAAVYVRLVHPEWIERLLNR